MEIEVDTAAWANVDVELLHQVLNEWDLNRGCDKERWWRLVPLSLVAKHLHRKVSRAVGALCVVNSVVLILNALSVYVLLRR